jgi:uncharacterized protein (DUF1778 family)
MDDLMTKPRVPVTLTDEQHAVILAAAERVGLTISAFIRMAALKEATDGKD